MKNKGFTLIEIIVCIALLSIITISSIVIVNKKNNDILKDINKKVSNAVDIYLNTKKDEDGDTYIEGINKGGQGLYINLKTLNDEGLIDKEIVNTLEKKENKKSEDLKILATKSISSTNTKECLGQIEYTFSWDSLSESPIYLCPKNMNGIETNILNKLINNANVTELNSITYENNYYKHNSVEQNGGTSQSHENGIVKINNKYYYRGIVENNYVIFINQYTDWFDTQTNKYDYTKFNDEYLFRILYFNNDEMKIITEKTKVIKDRTYKEEKEVFENLNNLIGNTYFNDLFLEYQSKMINGYKYTPLSMMEETYFKYESFCSENAYYDSDHKFKNINNCKDITTKIGMLKIDEAIIAGVLPTFITGMCNNYNSSSYSDKIYTNINFVSEGDGTIVWPNIVDSYYNPQYYSQKYYLYLSGLSNLPNSSVDVKKYGYTCGNYGYFNKELIKSKFTNNNIRPTLLLNMNNLYIKSGSGLKTDPYVIDIKNNS